MHLTYLLFVPTGLPVGPRVPGPRGPEDEPVGEEEEAPSAPPSEEEPKKEN